MGKHRIYTALSMAEPELLTAGGLDICVYTAPKRTEDRVNQDSAAVLEVQDGVVLAVADGAGGMPKGAEASSAAISALADSVAKGEGGLRENILTGFDDANAQAKAEGGATTLAVIAYADGVLRSYHAGDSQTLVTGQRGLIKLHTVAHSPVGYAVEAGVLSETDALEHEDRHLVSNLVGSAGVTVEVGSEMELAAKDTIVVGSDGIFDNVHAREIVELVRTGNLAECALKLRDFCQRRMANEDDGPSKPDDVTFVLARRSRAAK